MKLNIATLAIVVIGMAVFMYYGFGLTWTPQRIADMAIAVPCLLLLAVARLQLGRAFSIQAKATTLVTTGLYSRIRNPIYLFGALGFAGIVLWSGQPLLLLLLAFLIPMQVLRIRKEERVLTEKFGDAYIEYKRKTWF